MGTRAHELHANLLRRNRFNIPSPGAATSPKKLAFSQLTNQRVSGGGWWERYGITPPGPMEANKGSWPIFFCHPDVCGAVFRDTNAQLTRAPCSVVWLPERIIRPYSEYFTFSLTIAMFISHSLHLRGVRL